jgi:hypothetical protein
MLKGLAHGLVVLFVFVTALISFPFSFAIPNKQANTSHGFYCYCTFDDWGHCMMVCCDANGNVLHSLVRHAKVGDRGLEEASDRRAGFQSNAELRFGDRQS